MHYGDEYTVETTADFDLETLSASDLDALFQQGNRVTSFRRARDRSFFQELAFTSHDDLLSYRIDADGIIEVNNVVLKSPIAIRNRVADIISFQFISTLKRSEILGERKNVHDMGPAVIVSAVPNEVITTCRVPKVNEALRHVTVHTTLSTLMERMGESAADYPRWLQEILDGERQRPRQRVLFLEELHRDLIWSCFNLPVSGALLDHWMTAKFNELLCIGMQILKDNQPIVQHHVGDAHLPYGTKIGKARTILNRKYAHPPTLSALAQQLGMSETQLKSGFKAMNGTTIRQYCINRRIEAAKLLLNENRHSISEVADIVGYEDHSAFSRAFRRLCGCSPKEWRHQSC